MAINQTTKKSRTKTPASDSILEALRDIGGSATSSVKKDIFEGIPQDFFNQAFGYERKQQKASGDLVPGQSIEFDQVLEEQKEENKENHPKAGSRDTNSRHAGSGKPRSVSRKFL